MSLPEWFTPIEEKPEMQQQKPSELRDIGHGIARGGARFLGSIPDALSALIHLGSRLPWNKKASTYEDVQNILKSGGSENLVNLLQEKGIGSPQGFLGKTAERAGSYGPLALLAPGAAGISALAGQATEEAGGGPLTQLAAETLVPNANSIGKGISTLSNSLKGSTRKFPSGIKQPRVLESPNLAKSARISPSRQEKSIQSIGEEAKNLLVEKAQKNVPKFKELSEGFDFKAKHNADFGDVSKLAKDNPFQVDTSPIKSSFSNVKADLSPLPNKTTDQRNILKYIQNHEKYFRNKPAESSSLLDIYRNNNKQLSEIYGKKLSQGSQSDLRDFLIDTNKKILNSFEDTLGSDNDFVKLFKKTNQDYSEYRKSLELEHILKPVIGDELKASDLNLFSKDKNLSKLSKAVGPELANEFHQIGKDAVKAQNALKSIKAEDFLKNAASSFILSQVINTFSPGLAKAFAATKVVGVSRQALGYFLSNPERARDYKKALQAISKLDFKAFEKASAPLLSKINNESKDKDSKLPEWFVPE